MFSGKQILVNAMLIAAIVFFIPLNSCDTSSGSTGNSFENAQAMVEAAKAEIKTIAPADLNQLQVDEEWYTLIDVREEGEHDSGYIPGSVLIPRGVVEFRILNETFWENEGMYLPEKTDKIIVYCRSGNRSALVAQALQKLGFEDVYSLDGGFNQWKEDYSDKVEINIKSNDTPQGPVTTSQDDAGSC